MTIPSDKEYLDYLIASYQDKGDNYYRQFITTPIHGGARILDWGCGLGGMLDLLAREFAHAVLHGLDMNPACVKHVREKHPEWKVDLLPPPGWATTLPDRSFDRIFLLDVLEHCPEPALLLAECHRLLAAGGILTLSTPDRLAYHKKVPSRSGNLLFNLRHLARKAWLDPTHITEYSVWELERLLDTSPFGRHDLDASFWRYVPWLRPPKRYYSFTVNLLRAD